MPAARAFRPRGVRWISRRATIIGVGAPLNKPGRLKPVDEVDHGGAIDF